MKEIQRRIISIIYTLVFLVVSTWFVFGPREKLLYLATNINSSKITNKSIEIISNDILNYNKDTYNFSVINKTNMEKKYEIILVNDYKKSIFKNCKILSNNYLKYHIKSDDEYNIDRNVRTDGIIYKNIIKPHDTKDLSMELWLDKNKKKDDCYYPLLKIEEKL